MSIDEYSDFMGFNNYQATTNRLLQQISFKVARDFWLALVASEAEKIARLLSYQHYKYRSLSPRFSLAGVKRVQKIYEYLERIDILS